MSVSPVIILPTYNNRPTLREIVDRTMALGHPIVVVNDGSDDGTQDVLDCLKHEKGERISVIAHDRNLGKAAALQTGFAAARLRGYTHAVTLDTDGQHEPEDVPRLIALAEQHPYSLILGARDDKHADYPRRSRLGRRLSNIAIRIECGARVEDSQCGLRVYPLGLVQRIRCRASRYGFETEVITRAVWAGGELAATPVTCRYFRNEDRVTHLNPWCETARALVFHAQLVVRALLPWPHRRCWPIEAARQEAAHTSPRPSRLLGWMSPRRLWREVREDIDGPTRAAAGFGIGVFIANLPFYGLQTGLGLFVARRLHLHPITVVAGSHVSTPPVGPVLIAIGICVGHFLLRGSWPPFTEIHESSAFTLVSVALLDWIVGGLVLGVLLGLVSFAVVLLALGALARRGTDRRGNTGLDVTRSSE